MTIVAGDVLRVSMNFTLNDGTQYQNVYHYRRTGVAIITDAAHVSVIASKLENMYATIEGVTKNDVVETLSFVDLVEFVVDQWEVVENIGTFTITFTPTDATDALPNQVSPFIVGKTPRPKTVGRKFLFPMTEAHVSGSFLDAALVTALTAFAVIYIDNITVEVLNLLVPGVPRTGVDDFQDINTGIVTNVIGTQRRRRPGVGA